MAEASHWQHAAAAFQTELAAPMRPDNADAVLLTSMLLNLMSFAFLESRDPRDSWVFSTATDRLDWLRIQLGFLPLLTNARPFCDASVLAPVLTALDDREWPFARPFWEESSDLSKVYPAFVRLCGLESLARPETSPYYLPLRVLSPMLPLPRTLDNLLTFSTFLGSVHDAFFALLVANDEKALLILGYWLGLMCGIERWWCEERVRRDCTAICMYLDERGSPAIKALLDWMAWACEFRRQGAEPSTEPAVSSTLQRKGNA